MKQLTVFIFLAFAYTLVAPTAQAQEGKDWEKYYGKFGDMLVEYEEGDYRGALKSAEKLIKKADKKFGAENTITPITEAYLAKIYEGMGHYLDVPDQVKQAMASAESVYGTGTGGYGWASLYCSQAMNLYGLQPEAQQLHDQAKSSFEQADSLSGEVEIALALNQLRIMSAKGNYGSTLAKVEEVQPMFEEWIAFPEVDPATGEKLRWSGKQKERRLEDMAALKYIRAEAMTLRGMGNEAARVINDTEKWLRAYLSRKNIAYPMLQWLKARVELERVDRESLRQAQDLLADADKLIEKDYDVSHRDGIRIKELKLAVDITRGRVNDFRESYQAFTQAVKKGSSRGSYHRFRPSMADFERQMAKERTGALLRDVEKYLESEPSLPAVHIERIRLLDQAITGLLAQKKYEEAGKRVEEKVAIAAQLYGTDAVAYKLALVDKARYLFFFTDRVQEARNLLDANFDQATQDELVAGNPTYNEGINLLARVYAAMDEYDKAVATVEKTKKDLENYYETSDLIFGRQFLEAGRTLLSVGRYQEAAFNLKQAIENLEAFEGDDRLLPYLADAHQQLALFYLVNGDYDKTEDEFDEAEKYSKRSSELTSVYQIPNLADQAAMLTAIGEFADAKELVAEGLLDFAERFGSSSSRMVRPQLAQARLEMVQGEYTDGEKHALAAQQLAVRTRGEGSSLNAEASVLLSEIYVEIGDFDRALETAQLTLDIRNELFSKENVDLALAKSQLALVKFFRKEDVDEVEQLLFDARQAVEGQLGEFNPLFADISVNIAMIYSASERYDEAKRFLAEAEEIYKQILGRRNNLNLAKVYELYSDIAYDQRDYETAADWLEDAAKLYRRVFNRSHPDFVKSRAKLARVRYMQNDIDQATTLINEVLENYEVYIEEYFPALSERAKAKYWATIQGDYEFFQSLAARQAAENPEVVGMLYDQALRNKSLLLSSAIKIRKRILSSGDEALIDLYNEWQDKRDLLTRAIAMSTEQLEEEGIEPRNLESEIETLEKELSQRSTLFAAGLEDNSISWTDVNSVLKPGEIAIEMLRFRHFDHLFTDSIVYALVYTRYGYDKHPEVKFLANGAEMEQKFLTGYRNMMKYRMKDTYSADVFWKPIEEITVGAEKLFLCTEGVYNQVNLETMLLDDGTYVLDRKPPVLVSSTKDIYVARNNQTIELDQNVASIIGNPDFYVDAEPPRRRIAELPGTQEEANELSRLLVNNGWAIETLVNADATEAAIKELQQPKVFHIATHGFFTPDVEVQAGNELELRQAKAFENPLLRSGLMLTGAGDVLTRTQYNYNIQDGILTAYEAMNLNFDNTDLVVLSACETGLGESKIGNGVYGLQRSFMVAGSQALVMSLFKVSDEATQKLMVEFYKAWLQTDNMREAFVIAKKEVRKEFSHPIFWGAFIMIGVDE